MGRVPVTQHLLPCFCPCAEPRQRSCPEQGEPLPNPLSSPVLGSLPPPPDSLSGAVAQQQHLQFSSTLERNRAQEQSFYLPGQSWVLSSPDSRRVRAGSAHRWLCLGRACPLLCPQALNQLPLSSCSSWGLTLDIASLQKPNGS